MYVTSESGAAALCRAILEDIEVARAFDLEPETARDMLVYLLLGPGPEAPRRAPARSRESALVGAVPLPQRDTNREMPCEDSLGFVFATP